MKSPTGTLIDLAIIWAIASAVGFAGMAGLMLLGGWTLFQALFAAAIIFLALGSLLSVLFLQPLPGPKPAGTAGVSGGAQAGPARQPAAPGHGNGHGHGHDNGAVAAAAPAPAAVASPAPEPAPTPAPEAAIDASIGTRPLALEAPRDGAADDLKRIKGIGPKLEKLCHSMGFYHFDQIAAWTPAEVAWVDENLEGFRGRVVRDDWVTQARRLAAGGEAAHPSKVDEGGAS